MLQDTYQPDFSESSLENAVAIVEGIEFIPQDSILNLRIDIYESSTAYSNGKQKITTKMYTISGTDYDTDVNKYFANPSETPLVDFMVNKIELYLINNVADFSGWTQV